MIERRCAGFMFALLGAMSLATPSARAQSSEDVGTLAKQVEELVRRGNYADAIAIARRTLAAAERQFGPDHLNVGQPLNDLALLFQYQGQYDQAEPLYKRALAIKEQGLGSDHLDVAPSRETLAKLFRIQRRYDDSEQLLKSSLATREKASGPDNVGVCRSLGPLAVLYESQGRYADAEFCRKRCLGIREKALGGDHPDVGQSLHELARLYRVQGHADATSVYNRAIALLGSNHPEVILAAINAGEYEKAARALNLGNMAAGDREAHARAVRRTFFGQVTDLRWTSHRSNVGAATVAVTIEGEATHGNQLWQPFVVQMVREGVEWKLRSITVLGLAWK